MKVLTERGRGLVLAAAALWVTSRAFGVPEAQMGAVAALVLVAVAVLVTRLTSARLEVHRTVRPNRLHHGATATVELTIRNASRLPTAVLLVDDHPPAALSRAGRVLLAPLKGHGAVRLRYELVGTQRGRYLIGPTEIGLRDPFGVAVRRCRLGAPSELVVFPEVWRLPHVVRWGGQTAPAGEGRTRPLSRGEDFAGVREYVYGDDLRRIHWRSTARRGELMVRQDEGPVRGEAVVVLDTRRSRHGGHGPGSSFEVAVSLAASVALELSGRGRDVRLVTGPVRRPPPAQPWLVTLERLATLAPTAGEALSGLWLQLARGALGNGALVVIVPSPDPAELRDIVRAGRGFTTRVAAVLDAHTFGRTRGGGDAAAAVAALERAGWAAVRIARGDRVVSRWAELGLRRVVAR